VSPFTEQSSLRRLVALALIAALGLALLYAISPFVVGLLGGMALYVMVVPVYTRLDTRMPSSVAATITIVGVVILILLPFSLLIARVVSQVPDAVTSLQSSALVARLGTIEFRGFSVGEEITKASGTIMSWVSTQAFSLAGSAARALLNVVIALFALYFMLAAEPGTWKRFAEYLPFGPAASEQLRERFVSVTRATMLGIVTVGLLQGAIMGFGFWLTGFNSPLLLGLLVAIASVLPMVGSAIIWVPAVAVLLAQGSFGLALTLTLIGAVVSGSVDNLVRPVVYRKVSNIHPLTTLVGAFAGVRFFGLLGVLLGPLALEYFFELIQVFKLEYGGWRERPEQPVPVDPEPPDSLA
jgi:predicted PurR-regulated permease PerM